MSENRALEQLITYEVRGRQHVVELATEEDKREYWRAVSFRVGEVQLLLDEHDVSELLTLPDITIVPGTRRWVSGIANIRGELLPIVDFGDFLFERPVEPNKNVRVLVVSHDEVRSGLIVDQVYGMRRFPVDTRQDARLEDVSGVLQLMLTACYEEEHVFHVMDVSKLIDDSGFMQAAA